jgi:hypothetical protein
MALRCTLPGLSRRWRDADVPWLSGSTSERRPTSGRGGRDPGRPGPLRPGPVVERGGRTGLALRSRRSARSARSG